MKQRTMNTKSLTFAALAAMTLTLQAGTAQAAPMISKPAQYAAQAAVAVNSTSSKQVFNKYITLLQVKGQLRAPSLILMNISMKYPPYQAKPHGASIRECNRRRTSFL